MKNSYNSFASKCMKGASIKNAMMTTIGRILQSEIAALCSDDFDSIMRLKTKGLVKDFNHISTINKELQTKTPTLLSLLQWCFQKKLSSNTDVLIATIVSIMCKHRRPSACILQRIISLILYSGHSSKQVRESVKMSSYSYYVCLLQVFQRLQKIGVCISHSSTIRLVKHLGKNFDACGKRM